MLVQLSKNQDRWSRATLSLLRHRRVHGGDSPGWFAEGKAPVLALGAETAADAVMVGMSAADAARGRRVTPGALLAEPFSHSLAEL